MKRLMLLFLLLLGGCSVDKPLTEETVRVIASLDICYEVSLRNSEAISDIRIETDYNSIVIPDEWKPIYTNQRYLVREAPFYCDLWLNNPDFIGKVKLLLK